MSATRQEYAKSTFSRKLKELDWIEERTGLLEEALGNADLIFSVMEDH